MKNNQSLERAESLCIEFSDWVLYDHINKSVIFNTSEKFLRVLEIELERVGYREIHLTEIMGKNGEYTYTCVYQHK